MYNTEQPERPAASRHTSGGKENTELGQITAYLRNGNSTELPCRAEAVRQAFFGNRVFLRGIIEISNHCKNSCRYCGLQRQNTSLNRYRLDEESIQEAIAAIRRFDLQTVVLQSGEDPEISADTMARLIEKIKSKTDIAVTLSLGEWPESAYRTWFRAGADRYLLKMETFEKGLYRALHPGMDFQHRLDCIYRLAEIGYQTGSGIIVGLPGQNLESIASDLIELRKMDLDMISIGPFIPHPATSLAGYPAGSPALTSRAISMMRCLDPAVLMPAVSALAAQEPDQRHQALQAGANVLMPNFTPSNQAAWYEIYPDIRRSGLSTDAMGSALAEARAAGCTLDYSQGDSIKIKEGKR
ncbi:MAG: [FeFe] hydrogenase H-cluster radical SAM maturase HydE [Spirochaetales bacterium]|nr:[FeFe] hydrogenase H-cluster radical SAM maturase HydE [Spirochaetales bacterium]MCF7937535.1 [FeFe] hydrogenase H-cluster radical SAM maturase HydE [Spirochaetales bacterium]